ncbi:MAG TPA: tripartite tricarboxylate transporter substrate binding protein [Xanthobacteraceae bacterium]|nr:tripartite tricarboxylate transporter substrate binding protein [Xanthobacteraceae bacterium]
MRARRICAAAVFLAALALAGAPSRAQAPAWPQRAVKFIIPFGPGAGADIGARLFADRLSRRWGQTVVVENRPGADGIVAITAFVNANDDHTLLFAATGSFTVHPFQIEKLPYEPRDLNPIARVSNTVLVVAVPQALGVGTLAEMVALARAQPGKLNTALVPGITELVFTGFLKGQGLDMAKIPYRDIVQAGTDVAEGRVQVLMSSLALVQPHLQSGKVKLLAVTSHEPVATLPGIPTVGAAGYPALELEGLVGLFGPRDMPADLRERIAADVRAVAAEDPEIKARLAATGQVVNPGTAAEFAKAVDDQRAQVATIAQQIGMKPR